MQSGQAESDILQGRPRPTPPGSDISRGRSAKQWSVLLTWACRLPICPSCQSCCPKSCCPIRLHHAGPSHAVPNHSSPNSYCLTQSLTQSLTCAQALLRLAVTSSRTRLAGSPSPPAAPSSTQPPAPAAWVCQQTAASARQACMHGVHGTCMGHASVLPVPLHAWHVWKITVKPRLMGCPDRSPARRLEPDRPPALVPAPAPSPPSPAPSSCLKLVGAVGEPCSNDPAGATQ
jgi:hypothetical protein